MKSGPSAERIAVRDALGRVLADNLIARVDVPSFDRSNFDGYAIRAVDTQSANELASRSAQLLSESLEAGMAPTMVPGPGQAISISTGGMLPRGADAVLMVEHAEEMDGHVLIRRSVTPGFGISFAGTDIAVGETVLRCGTVLTSRETGVMAALGEEYVDVWRRPVVTIISTANEIITPGDEMRRAAIYDSNSQVLPDAVREQGGVAIFGDIIRDDADRLREEVHAALHTSDLVLLSGGTSKGRGDVSGHGQRHVSPESSISTAPSHPRRLTNNACQEVR